MQFKKITYSEYVERGGGLGASEIGVVLGLSKSADKAIQNFLSKKCNGMMNLLTWLSKKL